MNKFIFKILPLALLMAISGRLTAQVSIFSGSNENITYDGGNAGGSDYDADDLMDDASSAGTSSGSGSADFNSRQDDAIQNANNEPAAISVGNASTTPASMRPMDAPPDCPECVPDPGGDVPDVPFDKNLLVILFAGGAIVIIKANKIKML